MADAEALACRDFNANEPLHFIFLGGSGSDELIGIAGLYQMPGGEVELGFWIAKDHWNRGFAFEAGQQMVKIAQSQSNLTRLHAGHFNDNPASGRVLHKLGFLPEPGTIIRDSRGRGGSDPCQMYTLDLHLP